MVQLSSSFKIIIIIMIRIYQTFTITILCKSTGMTGKENLMVLTSDTKLKQQTSRKPPMGAP
jgi:hypothetical protein